MKVLFKTADGPDFIWDGMLWSGHADAKPLTKLDAQVLPPGSRHCSIVGRAEALLRDCGWWTLTLECVDLTGTPEDEEYIGEDVIFPIDEDVRYDEVTGRWVKFTKPGLAGCTADWEENGTPFLRNARPAEYVARLRRQNTLFEDSIELAGLWREPAGAWRIVTTQPHVRGERATMEQIRAGMEAQGFIRLRWNGIGENSESWRIGRMAVRDVHRSNVVLADSGLIVPIDVIITPLPDGFPPCHFHP